YSADPAALARVSAKLFDPPENLVDVAGVFVQDTALQQERVILRGAVAHFSQAVNPLVGIDSDQRARHWRARYRPHAHIGNLEVRRFGVGVDVLWQSLERLVRPECGPGYSPDTFQKRTPPASVPEWVFHAANAITLREQRRAAVSKITLKSK